MMSLYFDEVNDSLQHQKVEKFRITLPPNVNNVPEQNYPNYQENQEFNNESRLNTFEFLPVKEEPATNAHKYYEQDHMTWKEEMDMEEPKLEYDQRQRPTNHLVTSGNHGLDQPDQFADKNELNFSLKREIKEEANIVKCHLETETKKSELLLRHDYKYKQSSKMDEQKDAKQTYMYRCNECSYENGVRKNFVQHFKHNHSRYTKLYKCEECSYETRVKRCFTDHFMYIHAYAEQTILYTCDDCSYETRRKTSLTKHYLHKHAKQAQVHKCDECSYETRVKSNLTKHYKCKHTKHTEVFKCDECSYETNIKRYLTRHHSRKHKKAK